MKISSLIEQRGDVHHIFPKKYLMNNGYPQKAYNQVANFVYTEQATNIKIGMLTPEDYLNKVKVQIQAGTNEISTIDSEISLKENFITNDIPDFIEKSGHLEYEHFLEERRRLMANKLKGYYEQL